MLTSPRYQIREIGVTELIGKDEQVDQNDYGGSVAVTLGDGNLPVSGEILAFSFHSTEDRVVKKDFLKHRGEGVYRVVTKKPITAGSMERRTNPRARSAKLRVAERT